MKAPLRFLASCVLFGSLASCSSATPSGRTSPGGESGSGDTGGQGGDSGSGGAGGTSSNGMSGGGTGGTSTGTGGSAGTGDAGSGGSGGSGGSAGTGGSGGDNADASVSGGTGGSDTGGSGGTGAGGDAGTGGTGMPGGAVMGWYEAEAIPPNVLTGSTLVKTPPKPRVGHCPACPANQPIKPGDSCCSGGGEVTWLTQGVGPIPGGLTYMNVMAPSDGMYDVTWWYHCGNNDNFGDVHCGGQTDPPTTSSGCRPHQIVVNGTELPGTYHFPCFAGSFTVIHAATTQLMLKAGANSIKVYPKQRDSADMDALQVSMPGKGTPPLIKSNNAPGAN